MEKIIYSYYSTARRGLDDDYLFYEDGTIIYHYDKSNYPNGINNAKRVTADQISNNKKLDILEKCPEEHKEFISKVLSL